MAPETEPGSVQDAIPNVRTASGHDTWRTGEDPDSTDEEPTNPGGHGPILPPRTLPEAPEAVYVLLDRVLRTQTEEREARAVEHARSWERIEALTAAVEHLGALVATLASEVCSLRTEVAALRSRLDGLSCQTPPACPARPELTVVEGGGGE